MVDAFWWIYTGGVLFMCLGILLCRSQVRRSVIMYCVVAECGGKALWYFYCGVYRASAACVDLLELQLCVVN